MRSEFFAKISLSVTLTLILVMLPSRFVQPTLAQTPETASPQLTATPALDPTSEAIDQQVEPSLNNNTPSNDSTPTPKEQTVETSPLETSDEGTDISEIGADVLMELIDSATQLEISAAEVLDKTDDPASAEAVDGTIDIVALSIVASSYGSDNAEADINGDGKVDILDLSLVANYYGQPFSSIIPILPKDEDVPEETEVDVPENDSVEMIPDPVEQDQVSTTTTYSQRRPIKIFLVVNELAALACTDRKGEYSGPLPRLGPWERCDSGADFKLNLELNGTTRTANAPSDTNFVRNVAAISWENNSYFPPGHFIPIKINAYDKDGRKCKKILIFKYDCRNYEERIDLDPDFNDYDRRLWFNTDACMVAGESLRIVDKQQFIHKEKPQLKGYWCKVIIESQGSESRFKSVDPGRIKYTLWGFRPDV